MDDLRAALGPVVVVHGGAAEWYGGTAAGRAACLRAATAGVAALEAGGNALDAVTAAVRVVEDDPACNAGTGAVLTSRGTLELDACVMDGSSLASGAVAVMPPFLHPIDIARAVLEDGRYHLLAGPGAAAFARTRGFHPADPESMITEERRAEITPGAERREDGNTVGAVALDARGNLAAGTSTGGISGTEPGRVGDAPVVGAGTYADDQAACSCTGDGEAFARACTAFWTVEQAKEGVQAAADFSVVRVRDRFGGYGGLIAIDKEGAVGIARTASAMPHAIGRPGGTMADGE